ncbi:MAG: superoxide dismutase [Ni] [Planctomycetota bacterium]|jgi:nickel superoxide dismutase
MKIQNKVVVLSMSAVLMFMASSEVFSHCEIPCGIYDDAMRIRMIDEHIQTIEKSMKQIQELQKADKIDSNQLVRWTLNKENHADQLSEIVTQYFMTQRLKPVDKSDGPSHESYLEQLTSLHHLLVYSMKCKQTTDLANVAKLRQSLATFKSAYFNETGN